jgi:hypothetical protein
MSEKQRKRSIFDVMNEQMEEFETLADELMEPAFPEGPAGIRKPAVSTLSPTFS